MRIDHLDTLFESRQYDLANALSVGRKRRPLSSWPGKQGAKKPFRARRSCGARRCAAKNPLQ